MCCFVDIQQRFAGSRPVGVGGTLAPHLEQIVLGQEQALQVQALPLVLVLALVLVLLVLARAREQVRARARVLVRVLMLLACWVLLPVGMKP